MSEIEAIKAISDALEGLTADERSRVLSWAHSKFGGESEQATRSAVARPLAAAMDPKRRPQLGGKKPKKAKTIISMDKNLNLSPQGKLSADKFAGEKAPSTVKQKCVVAVYYLRDIIGLSKISVQGVFTYFKYVQWPVPADLRNILHQAGTEGWLDTADGEDLKLTSLGENLIEHRLPAKAKVNTRTKKK